MTFDISLGRYHLIAGCLLLWQAVHEGRAVTCRYVGNLAAIAQEGERLRQRVAAQVPPGEEDAVRRSANRH